MKTIYKLLIMGMLYLLSNTTYAQIVQYSDDGTQSCIDCEAKNSSTERSCLCIVRFELDKFNHQIGASTEKEKWLYEQELLLAAAITGISYFAMHNGPLGVPADYNFQNIQREYFKNVETNELANEYFTKADNILKSTTGYDDVALRNSTVGAKILDIRKREGTTSPKYGDLKYKGKLLKDMTEAEVNSALNEQLGIRNHQRAAATEYGIRNSRLQRMLKDGYIANTLAGHLVVHYASLDYEDAIRFMTRYMVWINNQKNQEIPHIIFGNPDNIFTLEDNETQYLTNLIARTNGDQPPMDGYAHPVFNEIPDDVALFNQALRTFGTKVHNFMNGEDQVHLKGVSKNYLEQNEYHTSSLGWVNNITTKYIDNELSYNTFNSYVVEGSGTTANVDLNDGANHVYRWKFNNKGENNGLVGLSNFFHELFKLYENHYALEGSIFRNMFNANSVDVGDLSNHDLGRLYDFSTVYPYGEYKYDIFFDVGVPYIGSLGFATGAAIAIANGGEVDFDDEVILDSSFLTTNAYCVYNELKKRNGNLFRTTIGSFIDDPKYKLYFRVGECKYTDEACTDGDDTINGIITIKIENTNMQSLNAAAMLLHEGIHAEMFRFVNEAHNSEVNPNDRKRLVELYRLYAELGVDNPPTEAQHTYMAENYVKPIARAIRTLDNNKYPLEYYMGYGWEGLKNNAHPTLLTNDEFNEFLRLKRIVEDNTDFNPINCN